MVGKNSIIVHIMNSPYNYSIQNCSESSDRVQFRFQSPKQYIIKHLILFDMGGGGMRARHNFVVIARMKFGTGIKLDVFYTTVTKKFVGL